MGEMGRLFGKNKEITSAIQVLCTNSFSWDVLSYQKVCSISLEAFYIQNWYVMNCDKMLFLCIWQHWSFK